MHIYASDAVSYIMSGGTDEKPSEDPLVDA